MRYVATASIAIRRISGVKSSRSSITPLVVERRRPGRKRLSRPRRLALDVGIGRHRAFLDQPDRLAGRPVEDEGESPGLVICATASMGRPSTVMSIRFGAAGSS
jgi:hypothetical protein